MHQAGLLVHVVRQSTQNNGRNPCLINKKQGGQGNEESIMLKLGDLIGAFVVFALGMGGASLVLIFEFIAKQLYRN